MNSINMETRLGYIGIRSISIKGLRSKEELVKDKQIP